ncbi:MAG TPA: ATP-binding protein, partial [Polyangiaceae bacterium]|nr:ATP-binding protein [Polyangiaceae bacterium]
MSSVAVQGEQVRTLYRHGFAIVVTNVVNACLVAGLLWRTAPIPWLLAFVSVIATLCTARSFLHRWYRRAAPYDSQAHLWGRRFAVGSAFTGAAWGMAGFWLLSSGGSMAQLILPFVVGGMTAAAAGTTATYLPAFFAFMLPAVAGLAFGALGLGGVAGVGMPLLLLVYAIGLGFVASTNHRALVEGFRFRFENQTLFEEVSLAHGKLEDANRTLEARIAERSSALKRQADELRDAQRLEAMGRLAGGVAHDFNNLLQVVLANSESVAADPQLADALREPVSEIRDAAGRGAELVKQLLLIGRRQSLRLETLDLNEIVARAERLLARLIGEHVELEVALHPTPLFVHVDPAQMEQVIINLAANARDAMPLGGTLRIETAATELAGTGAGSEATLHAALIVRDTGTGMDAETRDHAFDPFFTTKDIGRGTGLGLATVHGVVEQSGGRVRVESTLDRGSIFYVYLPVVDAPDPNAGAVMHTEVRRPQTGTVLLVEDDPAVGKATARILRRGGYNVLTAGGPEEALELVRQHAEPIDLLVSDVVMPGMSGPDLDRRLRELRPGLHTLFVSGYSRDVVVPPSDEARGRGYLAKPFTQ